MGFINELKRRNVVRVGIAYVLMGWVILQAGDFALDLIDAPNWVIQALSIVVVLGLPIALFFAWAFEMTPEGIKRETEVDRSQSITPKTGRKLDVFIIAILGVVIVVMGVERFFFATESQTGVTSAPASGGVKSIAVLPFVNMSSDPEQEFFSDGITEEVLNSLAKVRDLKVAGRTSSFAFKGRNDDLRTIGETLGVNHILEGSVRKSGNQVRITAQLIQVEDGFHLWSETYDRELTDVFAIQDEISTAILTELEAQLIGGQSISVPVVDLSVYDQFLLARQKVRERNEPSLLAAAELLDEVLAADPDYAPAWALRAVAELLMADRIGTYGSVPPLEAISNAEGYLREALRLDPSLPESHAAQGLLEYQRNNFDAAKLALNKALALSPNHIDAANWLQQVLDSTGQLKESKELALKINQLDPLYVPAIGNSVLAYLLTDDLAAARQVYERVLPFFSGEALNYVTSIGAFIAEWEGNWIEAIEITNSLPARSRPYADYPAANIWFSLMEYEKSIDVVPLSDWVPAPLARLGRKEEALQLSRRLLAEGAMPGQHLFLLADLGMNREMIKFVEESWGGVDSLIANTPGPSGFGDARLGIIAEAYRSVGNMKMFDHTLQLLREELDHQRSQGVNNKHFWWSESYYQMLVNNQDEALRYLQKAVDMGFMAATDFTRYQRAFKPLLGDPRMTALQQQMDQRRNRIRGELGLPPIES